MTSAEVSAAWTSRKQRVNRMRMLVMIKVERPIWAQTPAKHGAFIAANARIGTFHEGQHTLAQLHVIYNDYILDNLRIIPENREQRNIIRVKLGFSVTRRSERCSSFSTTE
jgi:hypothetical protein